MAHTCDVFFQKVTGVYQYDIKQMFRRYTFLNARLSVRLGTRTIVENNYANKYFDRTVFDSKNYLLESKYRVIIGKIDLTRFYNQTIRMNFHR